MMPAHNNHQPARPRPRTGMDAMTPKKQDKKQHYYRYPRPPLWFGVVVILPLVYALVFGGTWLGLHILNSAANNWGTPSPSSITPER